MKKNLCIIITLLTFMTMLFLLTSCKKDIQAPDIYPNSNNTPNSTVTGNGFSEEGLSTEGSLDDTVTSVQKDYQTNQWVQSDEYKRLHGRSSANLLPIYFNFDQAGVRADMVDILVRNARYLSTARGAVVIIEGNSDERGTNEYNMALAERRAINTRRYLIDLGVAPERMRTLAYGEENPLFFGQNEEAYKMNRRVDLVVQ